MGGGLTILVAQSWRLLTDHRPDGDGLIAYALVRRLAERGHRVHVVCREVDLAEPPPPGLRLLSLGAAPSPLGLRERGRFLLALRRAHDRLSREEGLDLVLQPNPVEPGVTLVLPRSAPPVVLGPYFPAWPSDVARPRRGGPLALARWWAARRMRCLLRTAQQRRAALLLLSTPAAREKVHVPGVPTATVPPGVDPEEFPVVPHPGPPRPPTALFFANLRAHKGIYTLLRAFVAVVAAVPDARLLIAGQGPEEPRVRAALAASPVAGHVELLGRFERREIPALMARGDVFCQPAFAEPFGTNALEAMACGLPLVSTDAGGLGHLVPASAAIKVPPGDADALARGLVELLRSPWRRATLGAAARRHVEEHYAWPGILDRLEEALLRVVEEQRPRGTA